MIRVIVEVTSGIAEALISAADYGQVEIVVVDYDTAHDPDEETVIIGNRRANIARGAERVEQKSFEHLWQVACGVPREGVGLARLKGWRDRMVDDNFLTEDWGATDGPEPMLEALDTIIKQLEEDE